MAWKNNKKRTTADFIAESKQIFGECYDYSRVVYTGIDNKVILICPMRGEFAITPKMHLMSPDGFYRRKSLDSVPSETVNIADWEIDFKNIDETITNIAKQYYEITLDNRERFIFNRINQVRNLLVDAKRNLLANGFSNVSELIIRTTSKLDQVLATVPFDTSPTTIEIKQFIDRQHLPINQARYVVIELLSKTVAKLQRLEKECVRLINESRNYKQPEEE